MQPIMSALSVYAAEVGNFDNTSIEDDLGSDVIKNYPQNSYLEPEIIYLLEYAYSVHSEYQQFYNIYLYVYNPSGKAISMLNEGVNHVTMVTGFGENGDDKDINSVALDYIDRTSDNLIYKFKLSNAKQLFEYQKEYAASHGDVRRYEFIKLQLKYARGVTETKEFAKSYEFSGYSAYCDLNKSPESTLRCLEFGNSAIELNLHHTNYRADKVGEVSSPEYETVDELNSVYFSIPNRYYNIVDEQLYGVKAEWYEYKTKPMFVTSDADAYSNLMNMVNIQINDRGQEVDANGNVLTDTLSYWRVFWDEHMCHLHGSAYNLCFAQSYNPFCRDDLSFDNLSNLCQMHAPDPDSWTYESSMEWLFYVDEVKDENAYKVTSEEVRKYMQSYTNKFPYQSKILGKYASGLFESSIDSDRIQFLDDAANGATSGKVSMYYTTDDVLKIFDAEPDISWMEFWFGDGHKTFELSPIVTIAEGDLVLDVDSFVQKYYVNADDATDIINYAKKSYENNETPVLLRFAVTDYYSESARFDFAESDEFDLSGKDGYVAQETMFLDFNVIELEFKNENGITRSVGAVAEPIDIINGLTPPDDLLVEDEEWWMKLVALILVVIMLMILYFVINVYVPWLGAIIRWVAGAFWWLFTSILKLITWPLRSLFSKASRKVKRKLNIRSPRGKGKGRRGRPKKEAQGKRMMRNASGEIKAKASETISSAKQKLLDKIADIKNKNKEE